MVTVKFLSFLILTVAHVCLSAKPYLAKGAELLSTGRRVHQWLAGTLYIPEIFSISHLFLKAKNCSYDLNHAGKQTRR